MLLVRICENLTSFDSMWQLLVRPQLVPLCVQRGGMPYAAGALSATLRTAHVLFATARLTVCRACLQRALRALLGGWVVACIFQQSHTAVCCDAV